MFSSVARMCFRIRFIGVVLGLISFSAVALSVNAARATLSQDEKEARAHGPISWTPTFDLAMKSALKSGKPILVDFWAEWCSPCKEMLATTYHDKGVISKTKDFVTVLVNVDRHGDVATKYKVEAFPTVLILDSHAREILRSQGFVGTKTMLALLDKASKAGKGK